MTGRWQQIVAVYGPALLLTFLLRLRFVGTPITSDEGGFLAIARAWGRGAHLYRDVWIDRPQGLVLAYRALDGLGLGTPSGVRWMAVAFAALGAVACGSVARRLFGDSAGALAAMSVAVLSASPWLEGFIANGELLSGSVGALALSLALRALHGSWRGTALAAGVAGGIALSFKQSGFDALATAVVVVVVASVAGRRRDRARLLALFAGLALPIAAMGAQGALTGWRRFWFAVAGYRLDQRSILSHPNWKQFAASWRVAAWVAAPVGLAVAVGLCISPARHRRRLAVPMLWLGFAVLAFLAGGQFHRHYWLILAFPLGTLLGCLVAQLPRASWQGLALVAVLAVPAARAAQAIDLPRDQVGLRLDSDSRFAADEQIAAWFERVRDPGDSIYALCASAGLYGNLDVDPPFPYLWFDGVHNIPGAMPALVDLLDSAGRPTFVAVYQPPPSCDPSGGVQAALDSGYRLDTTIAGVDVYRRV